MYTAHFCFGVIWCNTFEINIMRKPQIEFVCRWYSDLHRFQCPISYFHWEYVCCSIWHPPKRILNSKSLEIMMTSSNGNIFRVTGHSVPGEFPAQRPVTRSFDVFFDMSLNKRLSKQSWGWWFETLPCPLWRHHNVSFAHDLFISCQSI